MRCLLNDGGECLAKVPEACICMQMPREVVEEMKRKPPEVKLDRRI
jgi:hypothetical protein